MLRTILEELEAEDARVREIVGRVSFPGYEFQVENDTPGYFVRVYYREADVVDGVEDYQWGRRWYVEPNSTPGQIAQTCFKAVLTSLEHRAREHFLYRGKPVLQPHMDVDKVWEMLPDRPTHAAAIQFGEGK